ncbi:MAG: hypothetical protein ACRDYC_04200 [Acidimicrobiales bacterium]
MARRVVEEIVEYDDSTVVRMRVDLHGCSTFGPKEGDHTVLRWEWISEITAGEDGVVIAADSDGLGEIFFPAGLFGMPADQLGELLRLALSIVNRGDVLDELGREQPLE